MIDQCPSSKKQGLPVEKAKTPHELVGTSGRAYYRGLDDLSGASSHKEFEQREFLDGASELTEPTRRTFLKLMGAGAALAGVSTLAACRRPEHKIMPYSKQSPEDVIPGKAMFYASAMALPGGGAEGILAETHEGRPTKIEGNPLHPMSQGKSSVWAQASILDLYDPDRLIEPVLSEQGVKLKDFGWPFVAGWARNAWRTTVRQAGETDAAFEARSKNESAMWASYGRPGVFDAYDATGGAGVAFIVDKISSPTRDRVRDALMKKWPAAKWVAWDSVCTGDAPAALAGVLGAPARMVADLSKAKVIVSFDSNFLENEASAIHHARTFGASRRVLKAGQEMSRLYSVESMFTVTGASADHRLSMAPSQIPAFVVAVAQRVLRQLSAPGTQPLVAALSSMNATLEGEALAYAEAIAADLVDAAHLGKSALFAGESLPRWVQSVVAAMNAALGNVGACVSYFPVGADEAADSMKQLADLTAEMNAGKIETVVCLDVNPVFEAPGTIAFESAFKKVKNRVVLHTAKNETTALATALLNGAHYLEAWGDVVAAQGATTICQPMIAPMYDGKSATETLAMIAGLSTWSGYELVRETWRGGPAPKDASSDAEFEKRWRRALHDGVVSGAKWKVALTAVDYAAAAKAVGSATLNSKGPDQNALDVAFVAGTMRDGRFANNGWMQELPETASKVVWDNAAFVSPKTAKALGVTQTPSTDQFPQGRVVDLTISGRTVKIACWAVPGIAENTLVLPLGWGRREVGVVGSKTGFDVSPLRDGSSPWSLSGVKLSLVEGAGRWYPISVTQSHGSMEGRALVREIDKPAWDKFGGEDSIKLQKDSYGRQQKMTLGERLEGGELNHMPAMVPVYQDPMRNKEEGYSPARAGRPTPGVAAYDRHPQWGMTIDLSSCIGCNVCTIACQAENNVAIVGKTEVQKGREMHWIRIDRYFKGDAVSQNKGEQPEGMLFQPVACVHCEAAPCEVVCPVNATVHGSEGHNYMVYNRCIGTRYCANNCPYKVRRFNFFDYGVVKFQGGLKEDLEKLGGSTVTENLPANQNLIPPRLRKQLDELSKMQKNPNVTVRSRGVMEKCTYCIQRTNEAKIEYKLATGSRPEDYFPDGLVQSACQQACPTDAIVFGNILDDKTEYTESDGSKRVGSKVYTMREHTRSYLLLGFLNTRPRTSHLVRVNNPNVQLLTKLGKKDRLAAMENPFGSHGSHEGGGHGAPHGGENTKHSFIDPAKAGRDGYVLSLGVLPGSGVHA